MQYLLNQQGCRNIMQNKTCFKSLEGLCTCLTLTSMRNLHNILNCLDQEWVIITWWFMQCLRPPNQNLHYFFSSIMVVLDHYLQHYEDFIILGDFNENEHNPKMQYFLNQQGCRNIMKNKTCFKSMEGLCTCLALTSMRNLHSILKCLDQEWAIITWWFIQCLSQPTLS